LAVRGVVWLGEVVMDEAVRKYIDAVDRRTARCSTGCTG
jgi:hypothetical protein